MNDIYLANLNFPLYRGAQDGEMDGLQLRVLLSYWYYKDHNLEELFAKHLREPYPVVMADSGAFSAKTQGGRVDLKEYIDWIKRNQSLISVYSNLDIIGDAGRTAENQARMEDAGLAPMPVFHQGVNWDVLEGLIERYPKIALGGMVGRSGGSMPWMVGCFLRAGDKAKFHGFGQTRWSVLKSFPWGSVDSSAWGQGFRFGQVPVFDWHKGAFHKLPLRDRKAWSKHGVLVRELGFDPEDFVDEARYDLAKVSALSARSYMLAEAWLREWWSKPRG